jgi:hypothetical protein
MRYGFAATSPSGGAVGIALLYAVFHHAYIADLHNEVAQRGLPAVTPDAGSRLRDGLEAAEQTGLDPATFDPRVSEYLLAARAASDSGYTVVFLATTAIALVGLVVTAAPVRKPTRTPDPSTEKASVPDPTQLEE